MIDLWLVMVIGVPAVLFVALWFIKKLKPSPVPDRAVRQILDGSRTAGQEWVLARFQPRVSVAEASLNVGRAISEEERLQGFMFKLNAVSQAAPHVAIFYSSDKGFVSGRRRAIGLMLQQHGRWTLNTWWPLVGALRRAGYDVHSLDGPQYVTARNLFEP